MADQKISELANITGANLADADEFVVVDTSADQTKAVTRAEFFKNTPKIGVGTDTPTEELEVHSTGDATVLVKTSGTGDADATLQLDSAASGESMVEFMHDGVSGAGIQWFTDGGPDLNIFTTAASGGQIDFQPSESLAMRIDSSGNVGIGTSSPDYNLDIQSPSGDNSDVALRLKSNGTGDSDATFILDGGDTGESAVLFYTDGVEQASVSMTGGDGGDFNIGTLAGTDRNIDFQNNGSVSMRLPPQANGLIAQFYSGGTLAGAIGAQDNDLWIGEGAVGLQFQLTGDDRIDPFDTENNVVRDNAIDLGGSSSRFNDIYATNGTIQTSDRNEKQDIEVLSDAETRVAQACKGLLRKFRWIDAVAEKGDDARIHFGIIAQDLQDAFTAEGLDAGRYAMFISSTWWETQTEVPAVEAVEAVEATYDEDGNEITPAVEAVEAKEAYTRTDTYETQGEAPEGATERTRLGVRYPELLAFIIAAI